MTARRVLLLLAAFAAACVLAWLQPDLLGGRGASAPDARPAPGTRRPEGYAPRSASPTDAIPGGSLAAHEGVGGAHTLERHVGKSEADLRRRATGEGKREVSTFPDVAAADRAVAAALHARRDAIEAWLAERPSGLRPFEHTLPSAVGSVYRRDQDRVRPGRTVVVVLKPSSRFPEGFLVHTAYVSLP